MNKWVMLGAFTIAVVLLGIAATRDDICKPGDRGIYIGNMVMAGCPK